MARIVNKSDYHYIKSLVDGGLYTREEIASMVHISHTSVSEVKHTKGWDDYVIRYLPAGYRNLKQKIKAFFY